MPRYIGLDLHKSYIYAHEWQPEPATGRSDRFANSAAGWEDFLRRIDGDCWVAMEATGNAFEIHDRLKERAGRVVVANPLELKRLGSGRHTDTVDAARLAKMLALGTLASVWVPPPAARALRHLLRYRERLVSGQQRLLNQVKAVLRRQGMLVPRNVDPRRLLVSGDVLGLPAGERTILISALRQLRGIEEDLEALRAEIAQQVLAGAETNLLLTITGVGPITAAAIVAAIGDPHRFTTPKQLTRYAGLDPTVHQSGESYYHGQISKTGNAYLRTVLVEAANTLARCDTGELGTFYREKRKVHGHGKAVIALARKLLIVAWRMLLTGEVYRACKDESLARKRKELTKLAEGAIDWDALVAELVPAVRGRGRGRGRGNGTQKKRTKEVATETAA